MHIHQRGFCIYHTRTNGDDKKLKSWLCPNNLHCVWASAGVTWTHMTGCLRPISLQRCQCLHAGAVQRKFTLTYIFIELLKHALWEWCSVMVLRVLAILNRHRVNQYLQFICNYGASKINWLRLIFNDTKLPKSLWEHLRQKEHLCTITHIAFSFGNNVVVWYSN